MMREMWNGFSWPTYPTMVSYEYDNEGSQTLYDREFLDGLSDYHFLKK